MATIILISGNVPHAGKDTFAEMITNKINSSIIKLSDPYLKDLCKTAFSDLTEYVNSLTDDKTSDENWYENKNKLTRCVLQAVGGPILNAMNPNFLVSQMLESIPESSDDIYLVTDWRKVLEYEYLINNAKNHSIFTVRINRDIDDGNNPTAMVERDLDEFKFDFVIKNDGTLLDLEEKALSLMEAIEIYLQKTYI